MKRHKVYLAGPITGLAFDDSEAWRATAKYWLAEHNIDGFSPLRNKDYLKKEVNVKDHYSEWPLSSIPGINIRDYNDVRTADALLVNLSGVTKVSIGTVMEIAWARCLGVPVVLILEKGSVHDHGMLTYHTIVTRSLDEGLELVSHLLNA